MSKVMNNQIIECEDKTYEEYWVYQLRTGSFYRKNYSVHNINDAYNPLVHGSIMPWADRFKKPDLSICEENSYHSDNHRLFSGGRWVKVVAETTYKGIVDDHSLEFYKVSD